MPEPTTVTLIVRAAAAVVTDKRGRKVIGAIIIAVLSPLILAIALICALLGGSSSHNSATIDFVFNGNGTLPAETPAEYRQYLENMRSAFGELDALIEVKTEELDEGSLSPERIKAVFYALHFGGERLSFDEEYYMNFIDAFIGMRTEDGETITYALNGTGEIYSSMTDFLGRIMSVDEKANADAIYAQLVNGGSF